MNQTKYYSQKCSHINRSILSITKDKLTKLMASNTSMVAIGKLYNVSDTAIRKRCKKFNIPYSKIDRQSLRNARRVQVQVLLEA